MPTSTIDEQLTKYLTDAHAIEQQALAQMRAAPRIAGSPQLAEIFRGHLVETEEQERTVRARLEARGAKPSKVKEAVMAAGGVGFVLFAKSQPDTPGKLVTHGYSYEHLEIGSYELLARVAARAGDQETVDAAQRIRGQEQAMADRLAGAFDTAAEASLKDKGAEDVKQDVLKYLADAHALEAQAVGLLKKGQKIAGDPEIAQAYSEHLEETHEHSRRVEDRLQALGGSPSKLKDAALRLGSLNWGMFFQAQPDTPGKLAAFAFAFEHLEIGGYEQLKRVAERAGDQDTVTLAESILAQERAAAAKVAASFDRAVAASLEAQGVAAR